MDKYFYLINKMKFFFPFIIFLSLIKSFFPLQNEYISDFNHDSQKIKLYNEQDVYGCLIYINMDEPEKSNFLQLVKCAINCSIYDISNINKTVDLLNTLPLIIKIEDFKENSTKLIFKVFNNSMDIIKEFFYLVEKNPSILNYILEFLIESEKNENMDYEIIYLALSKIFNIDGVYNLSKKFYYRNKDDFMNFLSAILKNFEKLKDVFDVVNEYLKDYEPEMLALAFNIVKNVNSSKNMTILFANFFKRHRDIFDRLKIVMARPEMKFVFDNLLRIDNDIIKKLRDIILNRNDYESINLVFEILNNDTLLEQAVNLLNNINNNTYAYDNIGEFLSGLVAINNSYVDYISNLILDLAFEIKNNDYLVSSSQTMLQQYLSEKFREANYSSFGINQSCIDLFNYTYFNSEEKLKTLFELYLYKYIFDSSRNKGNFLTFDNCLSENSEKIKIYTGNYTIYPVFVIGIVYNPDLLEISKKSSFYSKYYYIQSYCLPNGFINDGNDNNEMCSDDDYERIVDFLMNIFNNKDKRKIESFSIKKTTKKINNEDYLYGLIAFIILLLPIGINIFLSISKKIIINKQKAKNNINELIGDDTKSKKFDKSRSASIKAAKNERKKKVIFPNWYLYLNGCFNIFNNGKELFNFSLNNTNYYNINGMTYIKGLIGISIILTVFGQTFVAIANFPPKLYGLYNFYEIMSHYILYPILFIGYKYGPRILFSCSGYSFTYKYLCYIEQEESFYFLKFIFLQGYKYILLFFVLIYFRYLLYYLIILFNEEKRPVLKIFEHYLNKEDDFLVTFFSFLFYINKNDALKQNLILHFFIPINEVFFFIFGMILISLGYKFKLRTDLIIIALIFIIYFLKIILYYIYLSPQIFTTIDYLLTDYGIFSANPVFNLTSFLIGIYFGLINYSIQKGITDLEKKSNYNNIIIQMSETENSKDTEEEVSKNNKLKFKNQLALKLSHINVEEMNEKNRKKSKTVYVTKKRDSLKNKRKDDVNDINEKNNEKLENFIVVENTLKKSKKLEYSEKIKQMPFLITPIKLYNFHRKNKKKCFLNIFIIIALLIIFFFIYYEIFFSINDIKLNNIPEGSSLIKELSYEKIIPDSFLNFIYLIDIEIVVFIVQWITFILYFKEFEIIRSFINHIYWSFFVKSYFSFTLVSIPIILFVLYGDESIIKLYIYNIILYTLINIIIIFIGMIIFYSFFEVPLKKTVKFILKGKEALNIEEDENDEEEIEEEEEEKAQEEEEDEECPKEEDDDV